MQHAVSGDLVVFKQQHLQTARLQPQALTHLLQTWDSPHRDREGGVIVKANGRAKYRSYIIVLYHITQYNYNTISAYIQCLDIQHTISRGGGSGGGSRWTLNKWVLSLLRKLVRDYAALTSAGRSLHHCGASRDHREGRAVVKTQIAGHH